MHTQAIQLADAVDSEGDPQLAASFWSQAAELAAYIERLLDGRLYEAKSPGNAAVDIVEPVVHVEPKKKSQRRRKPKDPTAQRK